MFDPSADILSELVTGIMESVIKSKALKEPKLKKECTNYRAEVFTSTWGI